MKLHIERHEHDRDKMEVFLRNENFARLRAQPDDKQPTQWESTLWIAIEVGNWIVIVSIKVGFDDFAVNKQVKIFSDDQ
jgi:hypothetical protein